MNQLRVATIVGTRPEIIKMSRIMARFDEYFDHQWIHTGQNWSPNLRDILLQELALREPDAQGSVSSTSPATQLAQMLEFVDTTLDRIRPDVVVVLGDTNSALTVYSARRRGVPVFHLEAGNRCFNDRTPEELNRRLVDHMSSVNLPYSEHARQNLLREGVRPDRIFVVGSPQREVLDHYKRQIASSDAARRRGLLEGSYILASLHREENVDDDEQRQKMLDALQRCARELSKPILLVVHPRLEKRLGKITLGDQILTSPSPGFIEYLSLSMTAMCVVSDSGTITEEASILGFPAVMLRQWHERPEGMDVGAVGMGDTHSLCAAVRRAVEIRSIQPHPQVAAYLPTDVSLRVTNIVGSYAEAARDDTRALV